MKEFSDFLKFSGMVSIYQKDNFLYCLLLKFFSWRFYLQDNEYVGNVGKLLIDEAIKDIRALIKIYIQLNYDGNFLKNERLK